MRSTVRANHSLSIALTVFLSACGGTKAGSPEAPADAGADASPDDASPDQAQPDAAPPQGLATIPLSSCVPSVYTAEATIGTQQFQVTLDTGSTTLGIASSSCTSCTQVNPKYKPGTSATDEHAQQTSQYGSGSWTGEIFQDTVALGSEPSVPVKFVAIDSQQGFFEPIKCDSKSGSFQGILGLGPATSALPGTNAFFDDFVSAQHVPDVFAFQLCDTGGTLWLGGYDDTFALGAPVYVPFSTTFVSSFYYAVTLSSITILGTNIPVATAGATDSLVDTGTSAWILPSAAFSSLTQAIASSPMFATIFGASADASWFASPNNCMPLTQTKAELDAALPPVKLLFGSETVDALPTESYLVSYQGEWCPALDSIDLADMGIASIMGSPILRSNLVVFDREKKRIGFAPHKACM
jgi:hypothetical protein